MNPASVLAQRANRLIIVVGPSGAGKDSVLSAWRQHLNSEALQDHRLKPVHFARRTITRPADAGGEAHEAVTPEAFERLRAAGGFAFWWRANDLSYGVRCDELGPLAEGRWVAVNGSRAHVQHLRRSAPQLRLVEITAPPQVLAQRLSGRGREDSATVALRLQRLAGQSCLEQDLILNNEGTVHETMSRLHDWWQALDRRQDMV